MLLMSGLNVSGCLGQKSCWVKAKTPHRKVVEVSYGYVSTYVPFTLVVHFTYLRPTNTKHRAMRSSSLSAPIDCPRRCYLHPPVGSVVLCSRVRLYHVIEPSAHRNGDVRPLIRNAAGKFERTATSGIESFVQ